MYDTIARLHVAGDQVDACVTAYHDVDSAYYSFGDDDPYYRGTILVKPARFGIHPGTGGVCVTLGNASPAADPGVEVGDWALTGSVLVTPVGTVGMYPYTDQYPIGQVRKDDPDTATVVEDLVRAVAAHYIDTYAGNGYR